MSKTTRTSFNWPLARCTRLDRDKAGTALVYGDSAR